MQTRKLKPRKSVRILSLYSQTLSTAGYTVVFDKLIVLTVEKERKKAEKQKKFDEKKAKTSGSAATAAPSKTKEKKAKQGAEKEAPLPEYVEQTAPGQKKSMSESQQSRSIHLTAPCSTQAAR